MVKRYLVVIDDIAGFCTDWVHVCTDIASHMVDETFHFICVIDVISHKIVLKVRRGD